MLKKLTLISAVLASSFSATANSLPSVYETEISNEAINNHLEVQAMSASSNQSYINELEVLFNNTFNETQLLAIEGTTNSPIVNKMYNRFGAIDGLVSMYRATGKVDYIEQAIKVAEKYFAIGVEDANEYKHWGDVIEVIAKLDENGKKIGEEIRNGTYHYEWRAGAAVAKILIALASDSNKQRYFGRLKDLANQLEEHVWQKWNSGIEEYIDGSPLYRDPQQNQVPHMTARLSLIALALQKWIGKGEYIDFLRTRSELMIANSDMYTTATGKQVYCIKTYNSDIGSNCHTSLNVDDVSHARDIVDYIFTVAEIIAVEDAKGKDGIYYGKYNHQYVQGIHNTARYTLLESKKNEQTKVVEFFFRDYVINIYNTNNRSTNSNLEKREDENKIIVRKNTSIGGINSSLHGSWAKFAKHHKDLRGIYYTFLKQGGIVCNVAGARYTDGSGNKTGKCDGALWDFEQAHFIASLALAYKIPED